MAPMHKFIPFTKADEAKREVWGIATAEVPDKEGEICDYLKTKPLYQAWSAEFEKATDGRSLGNVRYMHQLDAVGKVIAIEYRDEEKEIHIGAKVVDDAAWRKVQEGVLTGFSQGGEYAEGPDKSGRYAARPAELSLVDNPCLGAAHFAFVRSDGAVEMRKLKGIEKDTKTKHVADEDLPASAFAYVGDPDKTDTWKLPIKFSDEAKTKSHIRNALARFDQTEDIPASEKAKVKAKIEAAAREHGIDVTEKAAHVEAIVARLESAIASIEKLTKEGTMHIEQDELAKRGASLRQHVEKLREVHKALGEHIDNLHEAIGKATGAESESEREQARKKREEEGEKKEADKALDERIEKTIAAGIKKALEELPEATKAKGTLVNRDDATTNVDPAFSDLVITEHIES